MKQLIGFNVCPANKQCVPAVYLYVHAILDKVSLILQNLRKALRHHISDILANIRPVYKIFWAV
jgi:hypothetical protein